MILVTEREDLLRALNSVSGIVSGRNTIPILSHVLLSTTDSGLKIRASNGDMEASELISAHIGEQGTLTASADLLRSFVRALPEGSQVSFKMSERLAVSCGRARMNLSTLSPSSFPSPWVEDWAVKFDIAAPALAAMISRVAFAQEVTPAKAYLMGVRLEASGRDLRMVATNGAVLSYVDGIDGIPKFEGVTVPTSMVVEAAKMAAGVEGDITIGISDYKISLSTSSSQIISKLLDKSLQYPDYRRVIPKDAGPWGSTDKAAMLGAIRRTMLSGGSGNSVRVAFAADSLTLSARNSESDATEEIDAEFSGEEIDLPGEVVEYSVGGKSSPVVWRAQGGEDGAVVAMPQIFS